MLKRKLRNANILFHKKVIYPIFRNLTGINEYESKIETLQYLINNCIDINNVPKAKGILRKVQLADAELLWLVHSIFEKHKLTYWLDYGTLLGAIRHGGFIPWDDDLDIAMPRDDYEKAKVILAQELKNSRYTFIDEKDERICILMWEYGLNLDIFPMDTISEDDVDDISVLKDKTIEYRKFYIKNKGTMTTQKLHKNKCRIIGNPCIENPIWYHGPEFCANKTVFKHTVLFPLKKVNFEGFKMYAPNNCDIYLTEIYDDYMAFPASGILHHKAGGGGMHNNSLKYNVDIDKIKVLIAEDTVNYRKDNNID